MKFYTVDKLNDGSIVESSGIDVLSMTSALKIIEKKSELKTLDQVMDLLFVVLEKPYKFSDTEEHIFCNQDKKMTFALVQAEKIFQIKDDKDNTYFCAIHEGKLRANVNKQNLQKNINHSTVFSTDPIESKAINWLDNGRVGLSSATMCVTLFPELKNHHKLSSMLDYDDNDKLEINWPHDNDDFGRCMKFLEAVPEARNRLGELKSLSKEWKGLVQNWDKIETLVKEEKSDEAYLLIKESLGINKKKIKP